MGINERNGILPERLNQIITEKGMKKRFYCREGKPYEGK